MTLDFWRNAIFLFFAFFNVVPKNDLRKLSKVQYTLKNDVNHNQDVRGFMVGRKLTIITNFANFAKV